MKKRKIAIFLMIFIAFLLFIYQPIIKPAYLSYASACLVNGEAILEKYNVTVSATTTQVINESNDKVIQVNFVRQTNEIIKHEFCHVNQLKHNRLTSCGIIFKPTNTTISLAPFVILNEIECYTAQRLPDSIYEKIYDVE